MSFSGDQYPNYANKVITTRGDIVRGSSTGARERLGLGSANQVLQSDGTDIDWETLALADSTLTTQGDILYQNASGLARLGQSTDGYFLTTKGAGANPVWSAGGVGDMLLGTAQNITAAKTFNDSVKCYFGTDNDANIYHNGADLYITSTTGNIYMDQNLVMVAGDNLSFQMPSSSTLVSGAITLSTNVVVADTEGSASSDDFTTLDATAAGKKGSLVTILCSNASRTVNIIDTSGSIQFLGAGDFALDNSQDIIMFSAINGYTHNYEVSRSDNAA